MSAPLLCLLIGLGLTGLACGGAWDEASGAAISDQCDLLVHEIQTRAKENENKTQVVALLANCKEESQANRIGIVGISVFSATLTHALDDGVISDAERLALENSKNEMVQAN